MSRNPYGICPSDRGRRLRGPPRSSHAAFDGLTCGKSIGVCTALFMKFVSRNCAVKAIISTTFASVHPAVLTAANSSSETLPRRSISALAKAMAACRFGSLERPSRFSAISSGGIFARFVEMY